MKRQHDECRQFLESYRELRFEILRLQRKHQSLWDQATGITAKLSPVPGGGNSDRDKLLAMLSDADEDVIGKYLEATIRQQEIDQFIDQIPTDVCRMILRLRYAELQHWFDIKKTLEKSNIYYTLDGIYKIHGRALKEARELWNKRKETSHDAGHEQDLHLSPAEGGSAPEIRGDPGEVPGAGRTGERAVPAQS